MMQSLKVQCLQEKADIKVFAMDGHINTESILVIPIYCTAGGFDVIK